MRQLLCEPLNKTTVVIIVIIHSDYKGLDLMRELVYTCPISHLYNKSLLYN